MRLLALSRVLPLALLATLILPACDPKDDTGETDADADTDSDADTDTDTDTDTDSDTDADADPTDADGDGYDVNEDCDDADAAIHPGADDATVDGVDQDCDGYDGPAPPSVDDLLPGELVINEIMANPSGDDAGKEWFEVWVARDTAVDLRGLILRDLGGDSFVVTSNLLVEPGQFVVFGERGDAWVDYVWSAFTLGNATDAICLEAPAGDIDCVTWDNGVRFPDPVGASMSLDPSHLDATENDEGVFWCEGVDAYFGSDLGSPGLANPECPFREDTDGDGWFTPEDCDDTNAAVHPGATEIWYDGVDQDCSGGSDYDADADGYTSDAFGGTDCNDADATIHPRAPDATEDGVDQNCDGVDGGYFGVSTLSEIPAGALVITEIMQNPSGPEPAEEWFEFYVNWGTSVELSGLRVYDDDTDSFTLSESLIVDPGQYVVFGKTASAHVTWAYTSRSYALANGADEVCLGYGDVVFDCVRYDDGRTFPDPSGASMILEPSLLDATLNDDGANWCTSTIAWAGSDRGSPGAENESCGITPPADEDGDGHDTSTDCDDDDPEIHPGATEIWYDGVDQDCSGGSDYDADADGYDAEDWGGADCDDTDAAISPRASDLTEDGVDQNCDGVDGGSAGLGTIADLAVGDLVINEILQNPLGSEPAEEWFEVWVASPIPVDLEGLVVQDDGTDRFTVTGSLVVWPGDYVVFGKTASDWVDYAYTSATFYLGNGSDEVFLVASGTVIDSVAYDNGATFPDPSGASMNLDPDFMNATDNNLGAHWCTSTTTWTTSYPDRGSPGAANEECGG
jgi:hypothetical protein